MATGADYRVDLSIYNGPLDLLLHLIRERETIADMMRTESCLPD